MTPTSPATAAGGIHLHMAGKVGQKAVGTTISFGADRLPRVPPAGPGNPNGCLTLKGGSNSLPGWGNPTGCHAAAAQAHNVPASGSLAGSVALPTLPAGKYSLVWEVHQKARATPNPSVYVPGNWVALVWNFTIGADGTFTAIGVGCGGEIVLGKCEPSYGWGSGQ